MHITPAACKEGERHLLELEPDAKHTNNGLHVFGKTLFQFQPVLDGDMDQDKPVDNSKRNMAWFVSLGDYSPEKVAAITKEADLKRAAGTLNPLYK